jgi:hypothetical protein
MCYSLSTVTTRSLGCGYAIIALLLLIVPSVPAERKVERNSSFSDLELVDRGTIAYPLQGHIVFTNVGNPVTGMLVECFIRGWKNRVGVTKTNSSGNFSFPDLAEGRYYVRASERNVFTIRTVVTTTRKSTNVLSLTAEGCDRACDSEPVLK